MHHDKKGGSELGIRKNSQETEPSEFGPCDWPIFEQVKEPIFGEYTEKIWDFCLLLHHLGNKVKKFFLEQFENAATHGILTDVLIKANAFADKYNLWTRNFNKLPILLRENFETEFRKAIS